MGRYVIYQGLLVIHGHRILVDGFCTNTRLPNGIRHRAGARQKSQSIINVGDLTILDQLPTSRLRMDRVSKDPRRDKRDPFEDRNHFRTIDHVTLYILTCRS